MKVVLSGGGTAGHINPALALADILRDRGHEVLFAGTPTGVEARLVAQAGIEFVPFEAAGFGATVLLFSVPAPTATVPLPLFDVYKKELAIRGSFINPDTHLRAVELLSAGRINVEPLITHTFGIGEMEQAIKMQGFRPDTVQGEPAYGINGQ